ncbi:hypothetical protein [Algimonas porphyrae]
MQLTLLDVKATPMETLKTQEMHRVSAMNRYYVIPLIFSVALQACSGPDTGISYVDQSRGPEELTVLSSPRELYDTSLSRKTTDSYYCGSHLLETSMTIRREISPDNWFFNVDIDSELDGQKIDLAQFVESINTAQFQTDVALHYNCVNSQLSITIHLDQGSGTPFATHIGRVYVDIDTGEVMSGPRKSPKR